MTPFENLSDAQLLALCLYGEARGESAEGKIAVGSVILERARRGGWYGRTIRDVILKPYQFSCFLKTDPNYPKLVRIAQQWDDRMAANAALRDCFRIAQGLLNGDIDRSPEGATHYHTKGVDPAWDDRMRFVAAIGNHDFFAEA